MEISKDDFLPLARVSNVSEKAGQAQVVRSSTWVILARLQFLFSQQQLSAALLELVKTLRPAPAQGRGLGEAEGIRHRLDLRCVRGIPQVTLILSRQGSGFGPSAFGVTCKDSALMGASGWSSSKGKIALLSKYSTRDSQEQWGPVAHAQGWASAEVRPNPTPAPALLCDLS